MKYFYIIVVILLLHGCAFMNTNEFWDKQQREWERQECIQDKNCTLTYPYE